MSNAHERATPASIATTPRIDEVTLGEWEYHRLPDEDGVTKHVAALDYEVLRDKAREIERELNAARRANVEQAQEIVELRAASRSAREMPKILGTKQDNAHHDGQSPVKLGFTAKLLSNAAFLMANYESLSNSEARVIADKLEECAERIRLWHEASDRWEGQRQELYATIDAILSESACIKCGEKQAHIDRLMMEFCPDEMTEQQIENWAKHQKAVGPEESARIDKAVGIINIKVNGSAKKHIGETITYDDVVRLAGYQAGRVLSVTYTTRRQGDEQRQGMMHPGCKPVRVEEGMLFDAGDTSNA